MDNKEYKYDAFISYRHCELDKFVAENLHKILEKYELPKNIKKKLNIKNRTIKRVFRDQEELPLSSNLEDPIVDALNNSKYLIVICSPRLKDSLWCKKEIETFKKLRGRKNIFCVLIEGEPVDSFPEDLLTDDDNKTPVEPLAADVRGKNNKEVLRKIKSEKLRLIAPMYNLDYDDLRQRHKLRRQRRIINITIVVAIFSLLFALYTSLMLIKINNQQKKLKQHQAISLADKANDYLKVDSRYDAIKTSYEALTTFEGVKMPYTHEAEYALSEALGMYDIGFSYKAINELKTDGVVDYVKSSFDGKYGVIYDESENVTLFNTNSLKVIKSFKTNSSYMSEEALTFIGNDKLAFINEKGNISIVNTKDGKKIKEIKKDNYGYIALRGDKTGSYLTYTNQDTLFVYDVKNNKVINSIDTKDKYLKEIYYSDNSKYIFVFTTSKDFNFDQDEYVTMHVITSNNGKEINTESIQAGYVNGFVDKSDNAYIVFNNYLDQKMNSIILSYNYQDGIVNWSSTFENDWFDIINESYPEDTNDLIVSSYDNMLVISCNDGSVVESFNASSEVIEIYSFLNKELYLAFLSNGSVNYINMDTRKSIEYMGKYQLNIDEYIKVEQAENGFILAPKNENRIVLYELKKNNAAKKVDVEVKDYTKDDISLIDYDKLKEDYKVKNKSLVSKMFYDNKKQLLFVSYTNLDLAIYNVKDKKLITTVSKLGKAEQFYGKDSKGRIYLGDAYDSYILDEQYNKVGHIERLYQVNKNKLIVRDDNNNYYEFNIYSLDDMLDTAEKYLDK